MRTLKKTLCFVLAVVMILGLGAFSVSAKTIKDYSDAAEIKNTEAVDVLGTLGVLEGYDTGDFQPEGTLTRAEAAKIITYMLGITNLNAKSTFEDVPADFWATAEIAYCASEGIIAGVNPEHTIFDPNGKLTAEAFAKMLLTAIGYDAEIEGMVDNPSWEINIAKLIRATGLNKGLESVDLTDKPITRDNAAQMALNALKTPLVEYESTTKVNVNGAEVSIANANAKYVTKVDSTGRYTQISQVRDNSNRQAYLVEFAEEYQPKLALKDETDDFGRPARTWTYDKKDIGTYAKSELLVASYNLSVPGRDLYNVMGKTAAETYSYAVVIDGIYNNDLWSEINRNNAQNFSESGRGVLTEVYVDNTNEIAEVIVINTYLAIATADYNAKNEELNLEAHHLKKVTSNNITQLVNTAGETAALKAKAEDFAIVKDAKEDDAFLITVAANKIQSIAPADVLEESTISAFSKGKKVVVDDATYNYAATAQYDDEVLDAYDDQNLKETSYNIYLDQYTNLIGVDIFEAASKYAFVTGVDGISTSALSNKNGSANLIFLDGTSAVISYNTAKSSPDLATAAADNSGKGTPQYNKWVSYTVGNDDVYTLTVIDDPIGTGKTGQHYDTDDAAIEIDSKHVSLSGGGATSFKRVYGNDESVYLTAKLGYVITDTSNKNSVVITGASSVATGISKASIKTYVDNGEEKHAGIPSGLGATTQLDNAVYTLYNNKGYVIAAVVVGEDSATTKNLVYVTSDGPNLESYSNSDKEYTWTREVIQNGEKAELKEVGSALTVIGGSGKGNMTSGTWYQVSLNADGNVISATKLDGNYDFAGKVAQTDSLAYVPKYNDAVGDSTNETLNDATEAAPVKTVVYQETFENVAKPVLRTNTLYVGTDASSGVYVSDKVNVVIKQQNNNKWGTTYDSGLSGLKAAIDALNATASDKYSYEVNAVIEDGIATSVIFIDATSDGYTAPSKTATGVTIDLSNPAKVTVATKRTDLSNDDIAELVRQAIEDELDGYTVDDPVYEEGVYTFTATSPNGKVTRIYKLADGGTKKDGTKSDESITTGDDVITITYDNVEKNVPVGTTIADLTGVSGGTTGYVTVTVNEVTTVKANDASDVVTEGSAVTPGYVKVTVGDANVTSSNAKTSAMVAGSSSDFYALGTAKYEDIKLDTQNGTGISVNNGTKDLYYLDSTTLAEIDAADNASGATDGTAKIKALQMVSVTYTDAADSTVEATIVPVAYSASSAITSSTTGLSALGTNGIYCKSDDTYYKVANGEKDGDSSTKLLPNKNLVVVAGYVKFTVPAKADDANGEGLNYSVTAPAATGFYAGTGEITVTLAVKGTSSGSTGVVLDPTNGSSGATIKETTVTGVGTTTGITSAAIASNKLTITPKGSDNVDATYTITVVANKKDITPTLG